MDLQTDSIFHLAIQGCRLVLLGAALYALMKISLTWFTQFAPAKALYTKHFKASLLCIGCAIGAQMIAGHGLLLGICCAGLIPIFAKLQRLRQRRRYLHSIEHQLPDFLQLMAIALKAGLSLNASIKRIAAMPNLALANELDITLKEMRAGQTFADALRGMTDRLQVRSLTSVIDTLLLTYTSGGSIAETLVQMGRTCTKEHFQRAERRANQLPTIILAPLFLCILPPTLVTLFFPVFVQVMQFLN